MPNTGFALMTVFSIVLAAMLAVAIILASVESARPVRCEAGETLIVVKEDGGARLFCESFVNTEGR